MLCTRFRLPEMAQVCVALKFEGRIDSSDGHAWDKFNECIVRKDDEELLSDCR